MDRIRNAKSIGDCLITIKKEVSMNKLEDAGISLLDYVLCETGNIEKDDPRLKRILDVLNKKFLDNIIVLLNCNRIKLLLKDEN